MSFHELEKRFEETERLAAAVIPVVAAHVPTISDEDRADWSWSVAEEAAFHDIEYRLPGGRDDVEAVRRYLQALRTLRAARAALPNRLRDAVGFDDDADLRSEIASLKLLRDLPRYRSKVNMRAVNVVASARTLWVSAAGVSDSSWGAIESGGPTTSNVAFADFLAALLEALEIEGARPGTVADPKSAFQAFTRYTGNRWPVGEFPMDDEP